MNKFKAGDHVRFNKHPSRPKGLFYDHELVLAERTTLNAVLVVYRCYDTGEDESCFILKSSKEALEFLDKRPLPPEGYTNRLGYYYFEPHEGP